MSQLSTEQVIKIYERLVFFWLTKEQVDEQQFDDQVQQQYYERVIS